MGQPDPTALPRAGCGNTTDIPVALGCPLRAGNKQRGCHLCEAPSAAAEFHQVVKIAGFSATCFSWWFVVYGDETGQKSLRKNAPLPPRVPLWKRAAASEPGHCFPWRGAGLPAATQPAVTLPAPQPSREGPNWCHLLRDTGASGHPCLGQGGPELGLLPRSGMSRHGADAAL